MTDKVKEVLNELYDVFSVGIVMLLSMVGAAVILIYLGLKWCAQIAYEGGRLLLNEMRRNK